VHYTQKLAAYADALSRVMTITDVAEVTDLGWDTVKGIVKARLQKDYGQIPCQGLKYLSIDEVYVGKRQKFSTLVLDLESGRIVWVSRGRGKAALQGFWRAGAQSQGQDPGGGHGHERGLLGGGAGGPAQGQGGV
jgi:transposase